MESINNTTFASCFFGIVHPTAKTQLVPNTGIPMGFEQKPLQPNGPGIVGLVVVPMAGVSHKIIFVWDHMPVAIDAPAVEHGDLAQPVQGGGRRAQHCAIVRH